MLLAGCAATSHVPPGPTDAEVDAVTQRDLDEQWESFPFRGDVVRPEVDRVAFTTGDNWSSTMVSCLIDRGFDAHEVSGGFSVDGTRDEADPDATFVAMWVCRGEYPVDPRTTGYLSEAQALYMYDYFVERLSPCLRLLGYDVPPPPARDGYAESVRTGTFWNPYYSDVATPQVETLEDWALIDVKCAPLPDDPYAMYRPLGWLMAPDADPPTNRHG